MQPLVVSSSEVDTARVAQGVVEYDFVRVILTFLVYGYLDSETVCVAVGMGEASRSRASTDDEAWSLNPIRGESTFKVIKIFRTLYRISE